MAGGARLPAAGLQSAQRRKEQRVTEQFKRGDRVEWNFRGRTVSGRVRRRLTSRTEIDGKVVAASKDDPRYVVRSDKSGKETTRRGEALQRLD
jgi:Hypervirulence associated proteins TUDOR domain